LNTVKIVKANASHEESLKELLGLFFKEDTSSVSYLNTKKNIDNYYTYVILPLIMRDDPVLLAFNESEAIGLNCLSTQLNEEYELKYKTIHGLMTYIKPKFRRQGVAMSFKKHLFPWVISNGYERAIGEWVDTNSPSFSHTKASLEEFKLEIDKESTQYVARLR
jgi:hypothetical protein